MTAKRITLGAVLGLWVAFALSCGFGLADDSGNPIPATDYWGWMCADGGAPNPDSGCPPPGPCDDLTYPALGDGGVCVCDDGTTLPESDCETADAAADAG
jgi:hypothetical protein